ncbi:hypothetical protein O9H85_00170 [Paenibacillus filicis]|uniref:JmjC domain-containing protein n=1 Tax=Paenibacillus gyeongsangnamensis TaxID=3388067 RepID=A0ABT4Q1W7_9BACL|nr:hypothetical protein [Paenibacillus filicis]MCZ8510879.1 hypothetical protein [Paenibacillus filicis]
MKKTISTWQQFQESWEGVINFLMDGECIPFSYSMPSIEHIVDELRYDPETRITIGTKGKSLDLRDVAESVRRLSIEEALHSPFAMAHFKLQKFYNPGKLLDGFEEDVMEPWKRALKSAGFTWTRCYPILFISGPQCATNYHMDYSHVLAWQIYGTKLFTGLKDPDRWAPLETRIHCKGVQRPEGITEEDELTYVMTPGTVLWNTFLTPHWVEASDKIACSINISHGGLSYRGKLCRHEDELKLWQLEHPDEEEVLNSYTPNYLQ